MSNLHKWRVRFTLPHRRHFDTSLRHVTSPMRYFVKKASLCQKTSLRQKSVTFLKRKSVTSPKKVNERKSDGFLAMLRFLARDASSRNLPRQRALFFLQSDALAKWHVEVTLVWRSDVYPKNGPSEINFAIICTYFYICWPNFCFNRFNLFLVFRCTRCCLYFPAGKFKKILQKAKN